MYSDIILSLYILQCLLLYENNNIVDLLYLHACHRVGGMLQGARHYETLALFVIYFVLKMFKNIDFYIKTRRTQGVRVFFCHSKNVI